MIFSTDPNDDTENVDGDATEDVDLDESLDPIRALREEKEAALEEFNRISQRESEIETKIEKLEDKAEHVEREARVEEVLPGTGAAEKALKTKSQKAQDLRQEAEELRTKKQQARERLDRAKERLDEAVVAAIPEILEELETHAEEHRDALRGFAEKCLHNAEVLREYREERAELVGHLNRLLNALSDPDRRVNHAREHWVKAAVKRHLEDPLRGEGLALNLLEQMAGYEIDDLDEEPKLGGRLPLQRLK